MSNQIYCFSLYCEGVATVKSQAFVTIMETEEEARYIADLKNKTDFPPQHGWHNHQISLIVIPKNLVLELAKEYEQESTQQGEKNVSSR